MAVEKFSLQSHLLEKALVANSHQSKKTETTFYDLCKEASGFVEKVIEEKIRMKDQATDYIEIRHNAIVGDPLSVKMIKEHVQEFLEMKSLSQLTFPPYYSVS